MVRDPVCGAPLDAVHAVSLTYHGQPYYFCSHDCRVNFEDRPDEYVQAPAHHILGDIALRPFEVLVTAIRADEMNR